MILARPPAADLIGWHPLPCKAKSMGPVTGREPRPLPHLSKAGANHIAPESPAPSPWQHWLYTWRAKEWVGIWSI